MMGREEAREARVSSPVALWYSSMWPPLALLCPSAQAGKLGTGRQAPYPEVRPWWEWLLCLGKTMGEGK
ncbi:rCG46131 [Rattus norvegicus]|uniref:RCG46131 n=1 Tax=Rattus norvegicus TaxID=10116 RepID=A6IC43_RAT|nr:rCG46131 [Rattus norvegicus]